LIDLHNDDFRREGAILLALCPNAPIFHASWIRQTPYLRIPILTDPLFRLHRLLGISRESFHGRCCSVLIDPSGVLRFRHTHDFNGRGMKSLKEALIVNQRQPFSLTQGSHVLTSKGALAPCIL
jgi:alkyl hydroperoxide reductase subunit AhpC